MILALKSEVHTGGALRLYATFRRNGTARPGKTYKITVDQWYRLRCWAGEKCVSQRHANGSRLEGNDFILSKSHVYLF